MGETKNPNLDFETAKAFGITELPTLLPGGIDLKTFRSSNIVLRNLGVGQEEAAIWNAELFNRVKEDRFRVAKPIRAANGSWVVNGWTAEQFLEGKHATISDLPNVIDAAIHFHEALAGTPLPEYRKKEQSKYTRADEWAWGEIPRDIDLQLYDLATKLADLRKSVNLPDQLIHGDLNLNNVLVANNLFPAIIDFVPYYRPAEFALAVTAYWVGPYVGDIEILNKFKDVKDFDQMLIRAGLRMMLIQDDPKHAKGLEEYKKASDNIRQFVGR